MSKKLQFYLDGFSKLIEEDKTYKKIPYKLWRELKQNADKKADIIICNASSVYFYLPAENITAYIGEKSDRSMGEYLANQKLKEEEKDMATPTYTYPYTSSDTLTYTYPYISSDIVSNTINTINIPSNTISYKSYNFPFGDCQNYKEKDTMNTKNIFNFDFGPAASTQFRLSPCGLAIATKDNGWITYDPKTGDLVDANVINFDLTNLIYKMPVALAAIHPGDILMHSGKPVFVKSVNGDNTITAINYADATVVNILPVKSPFGFNFFTKICALVDFSGMTASNENPFGNMLPFLLMQDGDFNPMMLLLMNGGGMDFASNPMMLYFLMKDKGDNKDLLPFLFMMNNQAHPATTNPEPQTI